MPTPLLIISDAPTAGTGLARITRDLAVRIAEHMPDVFRVGTFGYGGAYSRSLPFAQYGIEGMKDWVLPTLPEVWKDFAGKDKGVIMTIWDASRLLWFARPENCLSPHMQLFLKSGQFKRYGYFPVDATGPHDRLTAVLGHTMAAYDRVLAYSEWAKGVMQRSFAMNKMEIEALPHGLDTSIFQPRPKVDARRNFGQRVNLKTRQGRWLSIPDDTFLVGIVATNQARKDYGLGISTVAELAKTRNVMVWIHTDELERHWSIPALINDFGLTHNHFITTVPLTDKQMSYCYSAADVTLGIGNAEGYGYPIFESLACGTPVVHGNYGGAAEHLPDEMLVWPDDAPMEVPSRLEGVYNCVRKVYDPCDWARVALRAAKTPARLPDYLDWEVLWPRWEKWLREGVK